MAIPMHRLGGRAFAHADQDDDETEREYDRLRGLAHSEGDKRGECFNQSQQAYKSGDGAAAKELSNKGKAHAARMDDYNRQASEFIFRANNAPGRIQEDEIDLHGQYVEEAERILEQRLRADRDAGVSHVYAIVGKGNHSAGGVQKLKPAVEKLCRELGLRSEVDDENEGRIRIQLPGGGGGQPQHQPSPHGQPYPGQQPHHGGHHGQQQQHQQQDQDQNQDIGTVLMRKLARKLEKQCCVVM